MNIDGIFLERGCPHKQAVWFMLFESLLLRSFAVIRKLVPVVIDRIDAWIVCLLHPLVHAVAQLLDRVGILPARGDVVNLIGIAVQVIEFFRGLSIS